MPRRVGETYATAAAGFTYDAGDSQAERYLVRSSGLVLDTVDAVTENDSSVLIESEQIDPGEVVSLKIYVKKITHNDSISWTTAQLRAYAQVQGVWTPIAANLGAPTGKQPYIYGFVTAESSTATVTVAHAFPNGMIANDEASCVYLFGFTTATLLVKPQMYHVEKIGVAVLVDSSTVVSGDNKFYVSMTWGYTS